MLTEDGREKGRSRLPSCLASLKSPKTEKQFHGGALLCFKKPEALLCVVEGVFCCWRRWNHGPEVAER